MKAIKESIKKVYREFSLTSLAVDNATSIILLTLMIVIFGISAYNNMPKEQYPEIVIPTISVVTPYPGNSAADIENLVTRPIEKELKTITGIDEIKSTVMQDFCNTIIEFNTDVTVEKALREVKDAVDKAKSQLPNDLPNDPEISEINFSEFPIMSVNISGQFGLDELRNYAEYLQDEIEQLPEISEAKIKGALEREVKINVDLPKMQALKISFYDISQAIQKENMTMSGGTLLSNGFRRDIRVVGEFQSVKEIEDVIVKSERLNPIYIKDFAEVIYGYEERTSFARSDQLPVVSLDIIKRSGENLLAASDKIKLIVDEAKANKLPKNLSVTLFNDQSVNTRAQVANLENSIYSGIILVVIVLLFFLGGRNSLFVGIAIPLSMLIGFLTLSIMGITMNVVVLFGLILALGLLVDNGIVVVENIYRYMQEGYSGKEAAKKGTGEVAWPIIASTATTLAAFVPLAFWPGIMGSFMKYLPITLIIVLTSSLFVALVINPVLTSMLMTVDEKAENANAKRRKMMNNLIAGIGILLLAVLCHFMGATTFRNLLGMVGIITLVNFFLLRPLSFVFQNFGLPALERAYDKFIRIALHKITPLFVLIGTFALLVGSLMLLGSNMPKTIFFPQADPLYVNVFVEMPVGTDIVTTNELVEEIEEKVSKVVEPYSGIVEAVLSQVGEGTSDPNAPPEPGKTPNKARITASFVPSEQRGGISTFDIMEEIRESVQGYAGVAIVVDKNADGPPTGKPINIEIKGENIDELSQVASKVISFLEQKNIAGVEELKADVELGKPEMIVKVDRQAAGRYEVSTRDIAVAIRTAIYGQEVSKFKDGEDDYPIMVRLDPKYRHNTAAILSQKITFRSMATGRTQQVPISAVADIEYTSTYTAIKRKDLDRMISVYSNILLDYNPNEVVQEVMLAMEGFNMPQGFSYEFTGEQQEQAEAMEFLTSAFTLALFSIFIILVTQFNSIVQPFIILISIILSTIGVFLGYFFTGSDLVIIMTGIGIISLAGVVVNNAIVLIDYINLTRKRKREELGLREDEELPNEMVRAAIVYGGKIRLRPVLLTAITTILGLIPLAIGFNFNFYTFISDLDPQIFIGGDNVSFWGPMAWTVIYGLTFATFLTLVVVPVMYWLFFYAERKVSKIFGTGAKTWKPVEPMPAE